MVFFPEGRATASVLTLGVAADERRKDIADSSEKKSRLDLRSGDNKKYIVAVLSTILSARLFAVPGQAGGKNNEPV